VDPIIAFSGVTKSFRGRPAVRDVSLRIAAGEAVLLTGRSGAGKSTLLRLIYAAERPDCGELSVAGRKLGRLSAASIPYLRRNIGVVFQDFKLLGERTVHENVAMPLQFLDLSARQIRARTAAALRDADLPGYGPMRAGSLSGGEQQRVALARAIAAQPAIVLADEPTGNLDPPCARDLLALLEMIHQHGTTLVVATHDPSVVTFGVAHGWTCARLIDGELIRRNVPRPSPHDTDEVGDAATA
jgi:cell division transport system ATP-binding protein